MNYLDAILLGIVQGLTEFLPVSSSGHIELGKAILQVNAENNLAFTLLLHLATVLSTIVVFRKEILRLLIGLFNFQWNEEKRYTGLIVISIIPVMVVGLLWKDQIEQFFEGRIIFVGLMLLITAFVLFMTSLSHEGSKPISPMSAFFIGIAQAIAVLPGISRSGSTIATALFLRIKRSEAARFSFLMVLVPVLGASFLEFKDIGNLRNDSLLSHGLGIYMAGFLAAFIAGYLACRWMIRLVNKGKIHLFALYCASIGLIAILSGCLA